MVKLHEVEKRNLTAGVLRIARANGRLATSMLDEQWSFVVAQGADAAWLEGHIWDGNAALDAVRFGLHRMLLASTEQTLGLADLARSRRGYTVSLATLARGALEALSRAEWILSSESADELFARHASLEYSDLRYPEQHGLNVHWHGHTPMVKVPVATYRRAILTYLGRHALTVKKIGITDLATRLLSVLYSEAPELYSGMSAAAHGQGWATGNFFDPSRKMLMPDDQMVIEYCAYVTEATIHVANRLIAVMAPGQATVERWVSERDQVLGQLDGIFTRRDQPTAPS